MWATISWYRRREREIRLSTVNHGGIVLFPASIWHPTMASFHSYVLTLTGGTLQNSSHIRLHHEVREKETPWNESESWFVTPNWKSIEWNGFLCLGAINLTRAVRRSDPWSKDYMMCSVCKRLSLIFCPIAYTMIVRRFSLTLLFSSYII